MNKVLKILIILSLITAFNSVEVLSSTVNSNQMVDCTYPKYPTKCVCPGKCMSQYQNSSKCEVKKCYKWDENLGTWEDAGKEFTPAIILQAIPFTGGFGSGFDNIGRWDIFGYYMIGIFGSIGFACVFNCCYMCKTVAKSTTDGEQSCMMSINSCYFCLYGVAVMVGWIWGIVVIANKEVLDGNGCKLV